MVVEGKDFRIVSVLANPDEFMKQMVDSIAEGVSALEIRLDKFGEEIQKGIKKMQLVREYVKEEDRGIYIIGTIRERQDFGVYDPMEVAQKKEYLQQVIQEDLADAIDLEIRHLAEYDQIIEKMRACNIDLIASHHDFSSVPSDEKLLEECQKAKKFDADIIKLAIDCTLPEESERLMKFLRDKRSQYPLAMIAMGRAGTPTRLVAPLWGSLLTYGYPGQKPSAPGQAPIRAIREFLEAPQIELQEIRPENMFNAVSYYLPRDKEVSPSLGDLEPV